MGCPWGETPAPAGGSDGGQARPATEGRGGRARTALFEGLPLIAALSPPLCTGGFKQRGIITYGLSANRQNPLAGTANAAVFNTWRRFKGQVLYFAPPLVFFYYAMEWATERYGRDRWATENAPPPPPYPGMPHVLMLGHRNHYLNSKPGRAEAGGEEE